MTFSTKWFLNFLPFKKKRFLPNLNPTSYLNGNNVYNRNTHFMHYLMMQELLETK